MCEEGSEGETLEVGLLEGWKGPAWNGAMLLVCRLELWAEL